MKRLLLLLCFLTFLFPGCSGRGLPGLVPVQGTVFFDGVPLEEAHVTFRPLEGAEGARAAIAKTDGNGKFTLMTLHPGDGISPGKYIVTVSKMEVDQEAAQRVQEHEAQPVVHLIPAKYASPGTSGLELTIGPKGDKNLELRLEK